VDSSLLLLLLLLILDNDDFRLGVRNVGMESSAKHSTTNHQ
jgi:hypothetical protein